MKTQYILLAVGCVFLTAALWRLVGNGWQIVPTVRTWLLIGGIFLAVALVGLLTAR
jgi:hypothetical protein